MSYTSIFEHIHSDYSLIDQRKDYLNPVQRAAWDIIEELYNRSGFDTWWDEIGAETRDEIFSEMLYSISKV